MPDFPNKVEFEGCEAVYSTKLALLVRFGDKTDKFGNKVEIWIPQNQIDDTSEIWKIGDKGMLVLSKWISEKKGLI